MFLRDMDDRDRELYRLADIGTDILYSGGGINALAYPPAPGTTGTPLTREIRRDGIDL